MTTHIITPAHDEKFQISFEVPRPGGKKPLTFTFRSMQYLDPATIKKWLQWWEDNTNEDTIPLPPMIVDWFADNLLTKEKANQVKSLTNGEKSQIWEIWNKESEISLGESKPSPENSPSDE